MAPRAPLTYFNDGKGGGGGLSDFFGSELLAKSELFESMKDTRIFWVVKKNRGIFLSCEKRTKGFFCICQKK